MTLLDHTKLIVFAALILIMFPAASADFNVREDYNFRNNSLYNAFQVNATEIYQDGVQVGTGSGGGITTIQSGDSFITVQNGSTTNLSFNTTSGDSRYLRDTSDSVDSTNIAAAAVGSSELASTTVSSGTYGNATHLPQLNIDQDGRITVASNVLITALWSSLSGVPAGFADGVDNDTTYTNSSFDLGSIPGSITEAEISDLDHYTDADIDGSESAFDGWDKNAADDFSGSWDDLTSVPAGFADDVDNDTTYTANGQYIYLDGTTFTANETELNSTIDARDTDTQLSDEQVEDIAGAMVSGNTETLISVMYRDGDGTLDFVVENDLSNYNNDAGFLTAVTSSDITDDTILEADLSTDNEPTDGYVLQYNATSGNFYWDVDNSAASGMASFNYGNETTTTEITDGETIRVTGGTGIIAELVGNTINLTNTETDTNLSGSSAGGDLTGTYPNPTISSGAVSDDEIDYGTVTLNDFTNDAGYALDSRVDAVNTSSNINSLFADDLTTDDDTTYTAGGEYIYLSSTQFLFNETQLNATIDARDTDTQLSQEQVEDFAGGMWTGNTEDGASVTYQDGDGTLDISVSVGSSHIVADAIKDSELDYSSVTLNDFTNDAGFVTSADDTVNGTELDGVFSSTGLLKRTGASTYTTITDNSNDWDTAFGWGDHSTQNYFDKDTDIGTAPTATGQVLTWDDANSEYDAGNINDIEGTLSVNAGGTGNAGGFTSGELLVGNDFSPISTTTDILSRDTSPQLGGDLDGQAFDISTTGNVNATAYDLDSGGQVSDNSSCTVITSPGGTGRIEVCD